MLALSDLPISPLVDLTALFGVCIERLNDAILITEAEPFDHPGPRILWANQSFYRLTGFTPDDVIGQTPRILQGPLTDQPTLARLRVAIEAWQPIRVELLNYRKDGSTYWNEFEIVPIANAQGRYTHWVSVQRDVTERKMLELKLQEQASRDFLTGLLNRRYFMAAMDNELTRLQRGSQTQLAVLMLDLDWFKKINDQSGHAAGDHVLHHIGGILGHGARKIDSVGRIGGEEFVVVMPGADAPAALAFGERLRTQVMAEPCTFDGCLIPVTVSIGVFAMKDVTLSRDAALARADHAMYLAKAQGRNRVVLEPT